MKRVFGVDLGGTTIKFSIIDQAGNFIDRWAIPTNTENGGASIPGDIIESLKSKMATLFERGETIEAIGVGVPGPREWRRRGSRRQPWLEQHAPGPPAAGGHGPARHPAQRR
ncbi:hypothetical protein [Collinsella sp. UBA1693]|uniref:hypothetical protein n=1 Tax=Collinsella sp. UBA1693 TaxID=1946385 RepID=UPI00257AED19|nr:hypothetical protein [Collinsella sp. UBA1693]